MQRHHFGMRPWRCLAVGSGAAWAHGAGTVGHTGEQQCCNERGCRGGGLAGEGVGAKLMCLQVALQLFHGLRGFALSPDMVSYGAAAGACERGAQWRLALRYLQLASNGKMHAENGRVFETAEGERQVCCLRLSLLLTWFGSEPWPKTRYRARDSPTTFH